MKSARSELYEDNSHKEFDQLVVVMMMMITMIQGTIIKIIWIKIYIEIVMKIMAFIMMSITIITLILKIVIFEEK